ncbi:hypothetical protein G9464_14245 [Halostella sp. JP-L12]|uniref:hypothetical protein n=1 Tax=Halostella TaxID=1843185 RepID=UPI000EF775F7|nr:MULTISPECIES: hypothetical protein [Halostella]NHN48745.1 hypothetical protein [Halostella sp. JP-L12]
MEARAKIKLFSHVSFACIVAAGTAILLAGFPIVSVDLAAVAEVSLPATPLVGVAGGAIAALRFCRYLRRKFGARRR